MPVKQGTARRYQSNEGRPITTTTKKRTCIYEWTVNKVEEISKQNGNTLGPSCTDGATRSQAVCYEMDQRDQQKPQGEKEYIQNTQHFRKLHAMHPQEP
jgi:hypothetical protein